MFVLADNGTLVKYPYSFEELKRDNPNTSFPPSAASLTDEQLYDFGVFRVYGEPEPTYDRDTQILEYPVPAFDKNTNRWIQSSYVRNKTQQELDSENVQIFNDCVSNTQLRLDNFAKTRNYDGILSLCTYATSLNPKFKAEGQYGVEARDATWAKLYDMLAEVEAGTRPKPNGYADIEAELPVLAWPQ